MRVLLITGEYPPMQGGVGAYTAEIAREFNARSVQVGVLTSELAKSAETNRVSPISVFPIVSRWRWSSLCPITDIVRQFQPDVLHIQYQTGAYGMHPVANLLPSYLRRVAGDTGRVPASNVRPLRPTVTTFHDLRVPYLFPKAGRVRTWVTRLLAQSSAAVIATNEQDYAQLAGWAIPSVSLIPIGSNISTTPPPGYERSKWRAQWGVSDDEMLLCYFGFLNESKGGETLVRALAETPGFKLLMIGGQVGASDPTNLAYLAKVKNLVQDLGLSERVLWTGFTPPEMVTANFLASDVCVLPYRDGASYRRGTLMAALAHGMPLITTFPSDSPERGDMHFPRLVDGENCLLVPPDDPAALARAIQNAALSPELRKKISTRACQLSQHFTWDKIVEQHLSLYERLLSHF